MRTAKRAEFAKYLNGISSDELFLRFGVTRICDITGLDNIGIPVWSAVRPASKTVSVSAGKSVDPKLARAGAVAEAIEMHTFENPVGFWDIDLLLGHDYSLLPLAKDSKWTPQTKIAVEQVHNYGWGQEFWMPSDMFWLAKRADQREDYFQMSSNGQAVGYSFEDAFMSGLYECIERDATTCRICAWQEYGVSPPRISLENLPGRLAAPLGAITKADLKLFLFYCTIDIIGIDVPVYWAILSDPHGGSGTFAGWGCSVEHTVAAERAILEAIQSRGVWIAGARDDILRRNFDFIKNTDPAEFIKGLEEIPFSYSLPDEPIPFGMEAKEELHDVISRMSEWKDRIFYKHIDLGDIHAVKTVVLGLEGVRSHDMWQPGRYLKLKKMNEDRNDLLRWANSIFADAQTAEA